MSKFFTVRLDKKVGDHYHCTIFASSQSAGKVCLREDEFKELVTLLGLSPDNSDPEFEVIALELGLGDSCNRTAPMLCGWTKGNSFCGKTNNHTGNCFHIMMGENKP